jgi:hypothetical protein
LALALRRARARSGASPALQRLSSLAARRTRGATPCLWLHRRLDRTLTRPLQHVLGEVTADPVRRAYLAWTAAHPDRPSVARNLVSLQIAGIAARVTRCVLCLALLPPCCHHVAALLPPCFARLPRPLFFTAHLLPQDAASSFATFKTNFELVEAHNAQGKSYTLAMNKFADLSPEQFRAHMGLKKREKKEKRAVGSFRHANVAAPASIDWRTSGHVGPIKDQGQCGSCWAFSAVGAFESAYSIANGKMLSLSEQQLVDCDIYGLDQGCDGGFMDQAFEYIIGAQGLTSTAAYAYTARDGKCKAVTPIAVLDGYEDVPAMNEKAMVQALSQVPLSVGIDAGA